jgi:hypothetical protein
LQDKSFDKTSANKTKNQERNRTKRKAAGPKACRFNAFREKLHQIKMMISHIQHFINNFQPIAD